MWEYSLGPGEETVRALARRCGSTHWDLGRRQSGHWPGDVAVWTGTWGGDSQGTGQEMWGGDGQGTGPEMWEYSQGPGEKTVRALARRCGSMDRDLGRRQSGYWPGDVGRRRSGHWPGDVGVLTGTWGGDSQGTGQEMWQYSLGPGEETVRALARRCGSMDRDLGRRQSGHWPGDVAVLTGTWGGEQSGYWPGDVAALTGTWGGDSQGSGQEMWQYSGEENSQGTCQEMWQYSLRPAEETVRALARRCGSTHRDLGRRQSGHSPGDVAVLTGSRGGDSQGTGPEMWEYSRGPGEETVRALARRCGSTHRDLGRRQSEHWPGDVAVLTGTWGGDSQGTGPEMWGTHRDLMRRQSGHWPGDVAVLTGSRGGDSQGTGPEMWQYSLGPGEETVRALARRCGSTHRDLGRRQSGHSPGDVAVLTGTWGGDSQGTGPEMWGTHRDLGRRQSGHWPGDVAVLTGSRGGDSQGTGPEMWEYSRGPGEETVRALARRCGSTIRDLGRRQSEHWPGDVAVLTGTWGGDSQGTGPEMWGTHRDLMRRQSGHWPGDVAVLTGSRGGDSQGTGPEMWQYSLGPGEETVRALARRCGVLTGTWGGDSQGTGPEMWQYSQEAGEETVRALARRCGSTHREQGRRQSGHWPGDVAVLTGTWGGDSQGTGPEMWQYSQGAGEETVRALARRCGSTHWDLGRRQSGHWPGDVGYSQGPGEETVRALARRCGSTHRKQGRRQSGHWPGDVGVLTGTWGGDSQGTGPEMWEYSQGPGEETVRALARRCGSTYRDLGRRQSRHWPVLLSDLGRRQSDRQELRELGSCNNPVVQTDLNNGIQSVQRVKQGSTI